MDREQEYRHWWIRTRFKYLESAVETVAGSDDRKLKIIEMGCGTGQNLRFLRTESELRTQIEPLTGIDPAFPDPIPTITGLSEEDWVGRKLSDAPRTAPFDLLVAMDVLEHIPDDDDALSIWFQLLRPGGFLFLTVPALPSLWSDYDVELAHQRRYTRSGLSSLLQKHSESILSLRYAFSFALPPAYLLRRLKLGGKSGGELKPASAPMNWMLSTAGAIEQKLPYGFLPGTSLVALVQKAKVAQKAQETLA